MIGSLDFDLSNVLELIRIRTGLAPSPNRLRDFEAAIRKTMLRAGIAAPEAFARAIDEDEGIFDALVVELTVGETYFFREPAQFDLLRRDALPDLMRNHRDGRLRVWSAGCASGEEAYSLAVLLEQQGLAEHASILGTDLGRRSLQCARDASYGAWSLRNSPPDFAARYFHRKGDRFMLVDRVRKRVDFTYLNLASHNYPSTTMGTVDVDLILCRNVLIYFQPDLVAHVARRLHAALATGGWLVTGPSDPPLWDHAPYETIVTSAGVFYRRAAQPAPRVRKPLPSSAPSIAAFAPPPSPTRTPLVAVAFTLPCDPMAAAREAFAAGDFARALGLTHALPTDADVCRLRVRALANLGQSDAAESAAASAVATYPLHPELRYLHAVVLIGLERRDEAESALRRVIYLDRSLAVAHFTLASLLVRRGAVEEAQRCYRTVLALCAKQPQSEIALLSDGEEAGRLAEAARGQLALSGAAIQVSL